MSIWGLCRRFAMKNQSSNPQAGQASTRDSDLARLAGGAIRPGEDYFREVLEALPLALYTTDSSGRLTYYNEAAAALWGRRPKIGADQWCGSWKLYWPDGGPLRHDQCPLALALKEGRIERGLELVAERPDGTRVAFSPFPTLLRDRSGAIVGAVNLLVDLSDRERARQYERRLASIVDSSDDAIISKDLNGIIITWNPGAERLFGYTADEMVGKPVAMLIPPERANEEPEILERIRRGERIDHYETIRLRKDGSRVEISLTVSPLVDGGGTVVGASKIAREITERRRAQEQKDLLLREAVHRVKNTLATVQAIAAQTLRSATETERSAFMARLNALADAHDLLLLESLDRVPLRDLIGRILRPFEEGHRDRFRIEGVEEVVLGGDKSLRLAMVLHELATNAVKYGALSNGTGRIRIGWSVSAQDQARRVILRWRESGGPPARPPEHEGFGSLQIKHALASDEDRVRLEFPAEGLACTLEISAPEEA